MPNKNAFFITSTGTEVRENFISEKIIMNLFLKISIDCLNQF